MQKYFCSSIAAALCWAALCLAAGAQEATNTPAGIFGLALNKAVDIVAPLDGAALKTFSASIKVLKADGLPKELEGRSADLGYQAPNRLTLAAQVGNDRFALGRDHQELWLYSATKKFGLVGQPGLPLFSTAPDKTDSRSLAPFKLPLSREQIILAPLLFKYELRPAETNDGVRCQVILVTAQPQAVQALKIPEGTLTLSIRETDSLPARIGWSDGKKIDVQLQITGIQLAEAGSDARWKIPSQPGDTVEKTALSHVVRFLGVAWSSLGSRIPSLTDASLGKREVVATEGEGRLETIDGTRVLFLKGSPEEMGRQHGVLMKKQIRDLVDRILYGVGVGSSFEKGRWFIREIEEAQARLQPHMDTRYLREMDAIAQASGLMKEEVRLANFFPELFHCSGFALFGRATQDGRMYHGRVLDYLRGLGLEQNAVVMVIQPDLGNAWVNVSYAGFVGSITAMNEKKVAIGEMGGRGEGNWDGKPMAQLVREVMEKASTLDEAVEIMRKGPRTCEYYFVISDAKSKQAVGIAATSATFEVIRPGQSHPRLPHAIEDAVLMSAGSRYEALAERVKAGHGQFDAGSARDLMTRPVCMNSNIHSALFAPDTLEFWVANADSANVASHTRYTHYNLAELLQPTGK
jgi:uncharacterized protein (DUF1810 family)